MDRKVNYLNNTPQESFFGHMKNEIHYKNYRTIEKLKILIDNYMDYYTNERYQ